MRTLFIHLLWLLTAGPVLAAETPGIKILSYSGGVAEIIVSNPGLASIYFQAPPGQNPESVEVLEATKWVPLSHTWCGTGFDFVELSAGASKIYRVNLGLWVRRGATFRFNVFYFSDADYKKFKEDHSPEALRTLRPKLFRTDPTDS